MFCIILVKAVKTSSAANHCVLQYFWYISCLCKGIFFSQLARQGAMHVWLVGLSSLLIKCIHETSDHLLATHILVMVPPDERVHVIHYQRIEGIVWVLIVPADDLLGDVGLQMDRKNKE